MKTTGTKKSARPAAKLLATIPSSSNPGLSYEVKQSQVDGVIYCSCPSWKFDMDRPGGRSTPARHPANRSCKHIRAYQSGILRTPTAQAQPKVAETPVAPKVAKVEVAAKEVNVTDLRKTAAYAIKKGLGSDKVLNLLKEGGLSDLAAWSLLAELDNA